MVNFHCDVNGDGGNGNGGNHMQLHPHADVFLIDINIYLISMLWQADR